MRYIGNSVFSGVKDTNVVSWFVLMLIFAKKVQLMTRHHNLLILYLEWIEGSGKNAPRNTSDDSTLRSLKVNDPYLWIGNDPDQFHPYLENYQIWKWKVNVERGLSHFTTAESILTGHPPPHHPNWLDTPSPTPHPTLHRKQQRNRFVNAKMDALIGSIHVGPVKWKLLIWNKSIGVSLQRHGRMWEQHGFGSTDLAMGDRWGEGAERNQWKWNPSTRKKKRGNLFTNTKRGANTTTLERQNLSLAGSI